MASDVMRLLWKSHRVQRAGIAEIEAIRRRRLQALVEFARRRSPLYRELYSGLPEHISDIRSLPATSKSALMPHFDDWITDRNIKFSAVREFIQQPGLIGRQFLGKYVAATTSGTTGTPGVFLLDSCNRAVTAAWSSPMFLRWLIEGGLIKSLSQGARMAVVAATGAHFVVATTTTAIQQGPLGGRVALFPAQAPLEELVEKLNRFRPALLSGYASVISLLAREQEAGRLAISPTVVLPGSEGLAEDDMDRIARAFDAEVRTAYVATECLFMAAGCKAGWLHLNSDWAILEAVDADHRPVAAGQQSHTVLVSNLANRIQPIIRYDLGDSVLLKAEPCACGSRLPAIRVLGRTGDLLRMPAKSGTWVVVAPLVLETLIDKIVGVQRFQIVQTSEAALRVRYVAEPAADPEALWETIRAELATFLASQGTAKIVIERANELPEYVPGRKYRTVVPLDPTPGKMSRGEDLARKNTS